MPRAAETKASRAWAQAYERGSVFDHMSLPERRAFREWLKRRNLDSRVFEDALGDRRRGRRSIKET